MSTRKYPHSCVISEFKLQTRDGRPAMERLPLDYTPILTLRAWEIVNLPEMPLVTNQQLAVIEGALRLQIERQLHAQQNELMGPYWGLPIGQR